MKVKELVDFLNDRFKPQYKENYDNVGFLIGDPETEVNGVLTTTDVTPDVVKEAIKKSANFIVSHHPLIFNGLKRITPSTGTGRMVMQLINNGIGIYAAHTNLDNLPNGVNGILAEKLGLINCKILRNQNEKQTENDFQLSIGAGMVGLLPQKMNLEDFFVMVKKTLNLPVIRTTQLKNQKSKDKIKKVAICGGSGSFLIDDAKFENADIYLTGDLKYHDFQAADDNIILADIGHFESEQFAKELFYRVISEKFSNFACFISEQDKGFVQYI